MLELREVLGGLDPLQMQAIQVTDFATGPGGDVLDINTLSGTFVGWDGASNPFGAGYLQLVQVGADTVLQLDRDGGGDGYIDIVVLQNTNVGDVTADNVSPAFPPDGSGINGVLQGGTNAAEALIGTIGDDTLNGLDGADTLSGGNGNDLLDGGADNDLLSGDFGNDTLTGGTGADIFVFNVGSGTDLITYFEAGLSGSDVIDLSAFSLDYASLLAAAEDNLATGNLEIELSPGTTLVLASVLEADLSSNDFIF